MNPTRLVVERLIEIETDRDRRSPDPELTPADVVRLSTAALINFEGKGLELAARAAAYAALAAGAHVGMRAALRMRIETHWRPNGTETIIVPDKQSRVMPLLPFVRHAVEYYLKLRGNPKSGPLLVNATDLPADRESMRLTMSQIAIALGLRGDRLCAELLLFFRRCFANSDHPAVRWLTGRCTRLSKSMPQPLSLDELRDALFAAHPLSGPARTYFGMGATFLMTETGHLPPRTNRVSRFSAVFHTDPVVRELRALSWPDDAKAREEQYNRLKKLHLPHLLTLHRSGKIRPVEIAFLLRTSQLKVLIAIRNFGLKYYPASVGSWAEWRLIVERSWHARPDGETPAQFWRRLKAHYGPCRTRCLYSLGLMRRPPGRPAKRRARAVENPQPGKDFVRRPRMTPAGILRRRRRKATV